jgi:hypothetical protein
MFREFLVKPAAFTECHALYASYLDGVTGHGVRGRAFWMLLTPLTPNALSQFNALRL